MTSSSGYSGTPLAKKLGIVEGCKVFTLYAPNNYQQWLEPLPNGVKFARKLTDSTDVVHLFATERSVLKYQLTELRHSIRTNASVWVSWPKKASKVPTEITEDTIRELCLPMGFVDIKVCAVNEVWSGLKLVVRKELR